MKLIPIILPALLLVAGTIGACSFRPDRAGIEEDRLRRFAERSYRPERRLPVDGRDTRIGSEGSEIDVKLLCPTTPGRYPLVIYLPGLGESTLAGARWRDTWAQAGYAVLTLQRPVDGPQVWSSADARRGAFSQLGRKRFGTEQLAARAQAVQEALDEIRRRAGNDAMYACVDLSRIALVGFELGAQTAMALAGERYRNATALRPPEGVKAAIALSPYVSPAGEVNGRYGALDTATLIVTGGADEDRYGLGITPALRQTPFRHLREGNKYQLVLNDGGYTLLNGADIAPPTESSARPAGGRGGMAGGHGGPGGGPSGGMGGGRPGGMGGGPSGGMGEGPPPDGGMGGGERPEGNRHGEQQRAAIVVQSVTLAFLDATLRADDMAAEWLKRNSPGWLEPVGQLQWK